MTITTWRPHQLLNTRVVAALLGQNPYHPVEQWNLPEQLPEPIEPGLWTPDQIRPLIQATKDLQANSRAKNIGWKDDELLTTKVCAALHFPKGVQETTFNSYVRRTITRREQGLDSTNEAPLPVREVIGHPLWSPVEIREYLVNRPGPGYHVSGDDRRGYRGGRVPVRSGS